jgi:hypothetical protein
VVEHERRGEPDAGRRGQPVAQLDGGQRVEADVLERPVVGDRLGPPVTEHFRGVLAHQVEHEFALPRRVQAGQPVAERGSRLTTRGGSRLTPRCG